MSIILYEKIKDKDLKKQMYVCYTWDKNCLSRLTGTIDEFGKKHIVLVEKILGVDMEKYKEKHMYEMGTLIKGKDLRESIIQAVTWNPKTRQIKYSIQYPKTKKVFENMTLRDELTEVL